MKRYYHKISVTFICVASIILFQCVENPFFKDDIIQFGQEYVHGTVWMSDGTAPDGILVWLEGFEIGVYTDQDGFFEIILPTPAEQPGGGLNGAFDLYFYLANYKLTKVTIVLLNGYVEPSQGAIDENGEFKDLIKLDRLVHVSTVIRPSAVFENYQGIIHGTVTLQAAYDSIYVVSRLKGDTLRAVFLKPIESSVLDVKMIEQDSVTATVDAIYTIPTTWVLSIPYEPRIWPAGDYEIIPFIWIPQPDIPQAMLNHLGAEVTGFGLEYLNLPFKRDGGGFTILTGM